MLIEIRGVGFVNKGAELMLHAIIQKVQLNYPTAKFVMAPSLNVSPYFERAKLGIYQKVTYRKFGIEFGNLAKLVTKKRREMYGLVLPSDIDIVLDAAGFAHGDQWGKKNSVKLDNLIKDWKSKNIKTILLPQAFGPFEDKEIIQPMKSLVNNSDLIFAREKVSYEHLTSISGSSSKIILKPDFTNLVEGIIPYEFDNNKSDFCIIPNYKMISKNWSGDKEGYIPIIVNAIKYLRQKGKKPFILVHEGKKDMSLAKEISEKVNGIEILKEENPLKVKGIIGACDGVIGSRFHSLVSSLSQGVPSLGTSWSHKYQMLFEDYGFKEGILPLDANDDLVKEKIDLIIQSDKKDLLKKVFKIFDECKG